MTDSADQSGRVEMTPMRPETVVMTPFRRGDAVTGTNYGVRCAGVSAASPRDLHCHIDQLVIVTELIGWPSCSGQVTST
jgi:hypothetical protein